MRRTYAPLAIVAIALPLLAAPAAIAGTIRTHAVEVTAGKVPGVVALISGASGLEVRSYPASTETAAQALMAELGAQREVIAVQRNTEMHAQSFSPSPTPSTPTVPALPSLSPVASPSNSSSATPTPSVSTTSSLVSPSDSATLPTGLSTGTPITSGATYPDALAGDQWALQTLRASEVWKKAAINPREAAKGTIVAIVDSGVDAAHPDLQGPNGSIVLPGFDATANKPMPVSTDLNGHGTHVAGIIGAVSNDIGVAGLAQGVRLLPVRVLGSDGTGRADTVARGIIYAADHNADVINLSIEGVPGIASFGRGTSKAAVYEAAIAYATRHGSLVVAAAGNGGAACTGNPGDIDLQGNCGDPLVYPAALPGVLSVGAHDRNGRIADFSTHNPYVDIVAPGVCILSLRARGSSIPDQCGDANSTSTDNQYLYLDGTSMAAPYASAAAAVTKAYWKTQGVALAAEPLSYHLRATARDAGAPGRDDFYGDGILSPLAALTLRPTPQNANAPIIRVPTKPLVFRATLHRKLDGRLGASVNYLNQVMIVGRTRTSAGDTRVQSVSLAQAISTIRGEGRLTAHCFPLAGTIFPVGTTTVTCTAVDAAGEVGYASFQVKVVGPGSSTPVPSLPGTTVDKQTSTQVPVPTVVHAG